jgi:hypothetical protein
VSHIVLRAAAEQRRDVAPERGRTVGDRAEAGVARPDEGPDDAERDQPDHRVAEQDVEVALPLALGGEERAEERGRERPVEDAGRKVPDEDALSHWTSPFVGMRRLRSR